MITRFSRLLITLLFCCPALFVNAQATKTNQAPAEKKFPESNAFTKSNLSYKIINTANKTFCYDIFADGKLLIHQPSIPGMPGNDGFKSSQSAEKVAQLVVTKIKNGEMPPTVTKEEMQKLKAIN